MRKKIFLVLGLSICAALLFYIYVNSQKEQESELVCKAFSQIDASEPISELYYWAKNEQKNMDIDTESIWKTIMETLAISEVSSEVTKLKDETQKTQKTASSESFEVNGILENRDNGVKTISVSIQTIGLERASEVFVKVENIYRLAKLNPEINLCIKGSKQGKLDMQEILKIQNEIMSTCKAQKVDYYEDRNTINISAYSALLEKHRRIAGKKVNLSIAFRYAEEEDKTYIWLATPVIKTDY